MEGELVEEDDSFVSYLHLRWGDTDCGCHDVDHDNCGDDCDCIFF